MLLEKHHVRKNEVWPSKYCRVFNQNWTLKNVDILRQKKKKVQMLREKFSCYEKITLWCYKGRKNGKPTKKVKIFDKKMFGQLLFLAGVEKVIRWKSC